jgi:general secretion pathway protein H
MSNGPPTTDHTASRTRLKEAAARLTNGLRVVRDEAISQRQERVFTLDVKERAFATESTAELVPLDPALNIHLLTVKSERVDESRAGIRFFGDGSSTGGRIELKLLGDRAAINVQWATGAVTVER